MDNADRQRGRFVSFRLSEAELDQISRIAAELDMTNSAYMRMMATVPLRISEVHDALAGGKDIPTMIVYVEEMCAIRRAVTNVSMCVSSTARELNAIRRSMRDESELSCILERHTSAMNRLVALYETLLYQVDEVIRTLREARRAAEVVPLALPEGTTSCPS